MEKFLICITLLQTIWILMMVSFPSLVFGIQQSGINRRPLVPFQYFVPPFRDSDGKETQKSKVPEGPIGLNNSVSNVIIASASTINPKGFDFIKLMSLSRSMKNSGRSNLRSQTKIIPLVWVDLPLFDTPVFKDAVVMIVKLKDDRGGLKRDSGEIDTVTDLKPSLVKVRSGFGDSVPKSGVNSLIGRQAKSDKSVFAAQGSSPRNNGKEVGGSKDVLLEKSEQMESFESSKIKSSNGNSNNNPHHGHNWSSRNNKSNIGNGARNDIKSKVADSGFSESRNQQAIRRPVSSQLNERTTSKEKLKEESDSNAQIAKYNFSYSVSNPETGDMKSHSENRDGDNVTGEYSILEPDGYTRIVKYTVDSGGFRATVRRLPPKQ